MTKRKSISLFLTFVMVLTIVLGSASQVVEAASESGTKEITILHINDTHGRAVEEEDNEALGHAKLKTYKQSLKNVLLLDAGDSLHGTTFATISRGESILQLMNEVGVDAFVPGNHDFNYGYDRLVELSKKAKFPVLAANVEEDSGKQAFEGNVIKEVDGVKVGIFGLATPETKTKSSPINTEGVTFTNYLDVADKQVKDLKDKGADVIVALVHLGLDASSEERSDILAEKVKGIDVIVDGHSHTKLENGKVVGDTLIAQTGEYFQNIGKITLTVKDGVLTEKEAELVPYATLKGTTADAKILEDIKKVEESNKPYLEKVVGKTTVELEGTREKVRAGETNLGNLLTDAMIEATGADVAITNGGGIRASIPAGDVTMGQIITSFPFTNYPVKLEVTGDVIVKALEFGVDQAPEVVGKFPHVGGLTFKYDPKAPAGSRVFDVKVKDTPVEGTKTYTLVTNDFMAIGGDGYEMFKGTKKLGEYPLLSEVLADYIGKNTPVSPKVEGRITVGDKVGGETTTGFIDIKGHWAEAYINDVVAKNLFNGMTKDTFEPNTKITRAMVVTVLGRFEEGINKDFAVEKAEFKDITDETAWYAKYVGWGAKNNIVKGYEDGTFKPNQEVTREEMATMISRYVYELKKQPLVRMAPVPFADDDKIAEWAKTDVYNTVLGKLVNGRENNIFDPKGVATRAEFAKILSEMSKMTFANVTDKKAEETKVEEKIETNTDVKAGVESEGKVTEKAA